MVHSLLIIFFVIAVIYGVKRWQVLPKKEQKDFIKKIAIWGGLGVVLALIVAGRAHWITGLIAGLIAVASRLSQLAVYFPVLKALLPKEPSATDAAGLGEMTRQQAAQILGVSIDAKTDDVKQAHKRLIQKLHPDRGGSEVLAKQINQARDVLLG